MYYPFVRKALLQFDLEYAHEFTSQRLHCIIGTPFEVLVRQKVLVELVNCMGLMFRNPLGLAAGLDKDGECIDALGAIGFGSIEIGIITPCLQPDNDKPRLFRLVDAEGLINRMGFNNLGVDDLVENAKKAHYNGVLGINIGKNKDTPVEQGKDDYPICMERIYAYVGYIIINTSSPSTPRLHTLQCDEALDDLLTAIKDKQNDLQAMYHKHVPIAMKVTPDLSEEELIQVADSLVRYNIDGVTTTNTTLDRPLVQGMRNCDQTGGLSGHPLQLKSTEVTRRLSLELNGRLPIIGVSGIDSVIAVCGEIIVGASLAQIHSDFILKGPPLIREIVTHIQLFLRIPLYKVIRALFLALVVLYSLLLLI